MYHPMLPHWYACIWYPAAVFFIREYLHDKTLSGALTVPLVRYQVCAFDDLTPLGGQEFSQAS